MQIFGNSKKLVIVTIWIYVLKSFDLTIIVIVERDLHMEIIQKSR